MSLSRIIGADFLTKLAFQTAHSEIASVLSELEQRRSENQNHLRSLKAPHWPKFILKRQGWRPTDPPSMIRMFLDGKVAIAPKHISIKSKPVFLEWKEYKGKLSGSESAFKRDKFPKGSVSILKEWLFDHVTNPYPAKNELAELMKACNLSKRQIIDWFAKARPKYLIVTDGK
jgi:hypothetical protein